jgi:sugar phosphate isomerase/epimerase
VRVGGSHLGYCTNIHPGETWDEIRANLERHVPEVKRRVCPDASFGLGLRLSCVAARELAGPGAIAEFTDFLRRESLYVFTINGFPYGPFHGTRVKEGVYRPDWRDEARLEYTNLLADLLAQWVPAGVDSGGSISTVPGAFRSAAGGAADAERIAGQLLRHAAHLVHLERRTGRRIVLALEPEPCCLLETVAETVAFFREHLHSAAAEARLGELTGLDAGAAGRALRDHLGVCLDLCHAAVEFEEPAKCLSELEAAGIAVAKIQITAGLRIPRVTAGSTDALRRLEDDVYLHQVVERSADGLERFVDLDAALASAGWRSRDCEWRVHFHVPVFLETLDGFASTQAFVREALALHRQRARSPHLEVETYTWTVLPERERRAPVEEAIARELEWVVGELS